MAGNLFKVFLSFFNNLIDVISQGSLERIRIISEFNRAFKESFLTGDIDRLCKVSISAGDPSFKHEMSSFYFRSGFKVTIENDANLANADFTEISKYILENKPFIKQLMALGFDTLIIKGKNQVNALKIPLKDHANLKSYMIG